MLSDCVMLCGRWRYAAWGVIAVWSGLFLSICNRIISLGKWGYTSIFSSHHCDHNLVILSLSAILTVGVLLREHLWHDLADSIAWRCKPFRIPISWHFGEQLIWHYLFIAYGISQIIPSVILRAIHWGITAAMTFLETVMCILATSLGDKGKRQRSHIQIILLLLILLWSHWFQAE